MLLLGGGRADGGRKEMALGTLPPGARGRGLIVSGYRP